MKGNIFTRAKAKVKNYMTNKNLERFEKSRSKKLGKPYVPASKKNKGFKKYDSSYKRTESPFTNITDPGKLKKFKKELKPTRKRILSSTQTPSGMMTEYSKADDIGTAIVYRKGGKKYTKDLDLEFNPTGEYRQITRKDKRILKKEGSYVSGRKMKRIKDDYLSGEYAKKMRKKRAKKVKLKPGHTKKIKSPMPKVDVKKEAGKKAGTKAVLKGAKKAAKKVGGTVAKVGGRLLGPVGAALNVATLGKVLHKEEVGQKAVKNIGKSKGQGTFLGKA